MKKRVLSLILAAAMVLGMFPTPVFAEETTHAHSYVEGVCEGCGETAQTEAPAQEVPTTEVPATEAPTEEVPTTQAPTEPHVHSGGMATCQSEAVCEGCGEPYGELGGHSYDAEGHCVLCGTNCAHESAENGACLSCGMTLNAQEPSVLTISAWEWNDAEEVLVDGAFGAPMAAGWEDVVALLPASITATVDGETLTLSVSWQCDAFPREDTAEGSFTFTAILPDGYALAEGVTALTIPVDLGGGQTFEEHTYDNGFCTEESCTDPYEPAVVLTAENVADYGLSETYIGYYAISNAGQLYWFAEYINSAVDATDAKEPVGYGYSVTNANVVLTDNITVNTGVLKGDGYPNTDNVANFREWTPIGTYSNPSDGSGSVGWSGIFDGNGKTVSGLYADKYSDWTNITKENCCIALLGYVGDGSTVKNVTVSDSYFAGCESVAGIVGYSIGTTFENCVNNATIKVYQVGGGIFGQAYNPTRFVNCCNNGLILANNSAAGIGCYVYCYVEPVTAFINCGNTGDIVYLPGQSGNLSGFLLSGSQTTTFTNCYNTGDIIVNGLNPSYSYTFSGFTKNGGYFYNCYTSGQIVVGEPTSKITIQRFSKTYKTYTKGSNNYCLDYELPNGIGTVSDPEEGIVAKVTEEQFKSGEVAYLLQENLVYDGETKPNVWGQTIGKDQSPVLGGKAVYKFDDGYTNTNTPPVKYTVTVTPGANMTLTSGEATQIVSGAITDIVFTAEDGYYFPEPYSVEEQNGITVTRNSNTQITVSGTPTAEVTITLPNASQKCVHQWGEDGTCTLCGTTCPHSALTKGKCDTCGKQFAFTVENAPFDTLADAVAAAGENGTVYLWSDYTIPKDTEVTLPAGVTLRVPNNVTLNN